MWGATLAYLLSIKFQPRNSICLVSFMILKGKLNKTFHVKDLKSLPFYVELIVNGKIKRK